MFQYVAFYKPYGYLSQFSAESGHKGLAGFHLPSGIYAAGRLDHDSEGLLLLTDDGRLIKKLLDPVFAHPRSYLAQLDGTITPAALETLCRGVVIRGYKTKPCQAEILQDSPDLPERNPPIRFRKNIPTSWIRLTLTEGKNRQVRRMTAAVGFPTLRLVRTAIGRLTLDGLNPGQWKKVQKNDIF